MGHVPSMLFLILFFVIVLQLASAQAGDLDNVDFITIEGFYDVRTCVQNSLNEMVLLFGCRRDSYGYRFNSCFCRHSGLDLALQIIQEETFQDCQNADDANLARIMLLDYCKSKEHVSGVSSVTLPSSTGGLLSLPLLFSQLSTVMASGCSSSHAFAPVQRSVHKRAPDPGALLHTFSLWLFG